MGAARLSVIVTEAMADPERPLKVRIRSIGRKEADICIPDDKSLSRQHAELTLSGEGFSSLMVRDLKSKFGVTVGETRLGAEPAALSHGSTMKLGSTIFKVSRIPIVLCASGVSAAERPALKAAAAKLSGGGAS